MIASAVLGSLSFGAIFWKPLLGQDNIDQSHKQRMGHAKTPPEILPIPALLIIYGIRAFAAAVEHSLPGSILFVDWVSPRGSIPYSLEGDGTCIECGV
jgi:hypothetical protein